MLRTVEQCADRPAQALRGPDGVGRLLAPRREQRLADGDLAGGVRRLDRRAADITIHETTDPEVIVAEFAYRGTVVETGEPFALPGVFVLRVRDGRIVSSRDYFDHLTAARVRGQFDALVDAVRADAGAS